MKYKYSTNNFHSFYNVNLLNLNLFEGKMH